MKKIKLIPFLFCLLIFASCHSKLEVEDVLSAIEKKQVLSNGLTTGFWIGDKETVDKQDIWKYKKLAGEGLINLDSLGQSFYSGIYCRLSLTDKANEYVEKEEDKKDRQTAEQNEIDRLLGNETKMRKYITVRVAAIRVTEVKDIHEIPSENRAQAKIVLEAEDKTPFWLLSSDTATHKEIKINLIKTTGGWTLDD